MVLIKCFTVFFIILIKLHYVMSRSRRDDFMTNKDKQRMFACKLEEECTPSDEKVCGFDEEVPFLAVFGDLCTMHRATCRDVGFFRQVDMIVCDIKLKYEKEQEERHVTFYDVIHVANDSNAHKHELQPTAHEHPMVKLVNADDDK
ncbi:uncharacterized protein LOC142982224 isoform X2 [Anticarsia gemmatalis]|uniref:uncharacterized protein LOC142982224 isoform X2 n=1 Tax=Anticarsia gemmatalis TaxID=129554 RepID=UPI003F7616F5